MFIGYLDPETILFDNENKDAGVIKPIFWLFKITGIQYTSDVVF